MKTLHLIPILLLSSAATFGQNSPSYGSADGNGVYWLTRPRVFGVTNLVVKNLTNEAGTAGEIALHNAQQKLVSTNAAGVRGILSLPVFQSTDPGSTLLFPKWNDSDNQMEYKNAEDYRSAIGAGNVSGPGSATVGRLAAFGNTGGDVLEEVPVDVDEDGNISTDGSILADHYESSSTDPYLLELPLGGSITNAANGVSLTNNIPVVHNSNVVLNAGLRLKVGADPDVDVEGQISYDSDDDVLRGYDGANQVALGQKIKTIQVTVISPNDLADAVRDAFWCWSNETGMDFVVTGWKAWSDTDDTSLAIEEVDADGVSNAATVDAVEIATGSGPYTGSDTTISAATVENGHMLRLDFDDTDTPGIVKLTIYGYFNANVN
jgi:hypothetical protein